MRPETFTASGDHALGERVLLNISSTLVESYHGLEGFGIPASLGVFRALAAGCILLSSATALVRVFRSDDAENEEKQDLSQERWSVLRAMIARSVIIHLDHTILLPSSFDLAQAVGYSSVTAGAVSGFLVGVAPFSNAIGNLTAALLASKLHHAMLKNISGGQVPA